MKKFAKFLILSSFFMLPNCFQQNGMGISLVLDQVLQHSKHAAYSIKGKRSGRVFSTCHWHLVGRDNGQAPSKDSATPVSALARSWALATRIGVGHRRSELIHSVREVCRERSLHLQKVNIGLFTIQDNSLREPGSPIGESYKSPLKRQCCTVQTHLNGSCVGRTDLSDKPV
jgi:hypothetical protein